MALFIPSSKVLEFEGLPPGVQADSRRLAARLSSVFGLTSHVTSVLRDAPQHRGAMAVDIGFRLRGWSPVLEGVSPAFDRDDQFLLALLALETPPPRSAIVVEPDHVHIMDAPHLAPHGIYSYEGSSPYPSDLAYRELRRASGLPGSSLTPIRDILS